MLRLGRVSSVLRSLRTSVSSSYTFSISRVSLKTSACPPPCRARPLSTTAESDDSLFNYTSGRWVYNDALRHKERHRPFNVTSLCRLAAQSVDRDPTDVLSISKLDEGGFNRTFLITLRDGTKVVARIPYPVTVPDYNGVASEVATIEYMRLHGIPVPEIYGYSAHADNAAETPYIFMQYVQGEQLSEVWRNLKDEEVVDVIRQLTQLEARMMALSFPAGGSIYFAKDLDYVAAGPGIPLEDDRFCIGPDTRLAMWYGRRAQLDVYRGPYKSTEAALIAPAHKEMTYLKWFGQPLLPLRRERRPSYEFQLQSPSEHVEHLKQYLSVTPSLLPQDPALDRFCIRHPDLQPSNIFISRSPESGCRITSIIDWQHTSILPMFILAGIPQRLQNYGDDFSESMTPPSPPKNLEKLSEAERDRAEYVHWCRLVHYHYVNSTREYNPLHHAAFTDPLFAVRNRLFVHASAPWEGESSDLKTTLIETAENWNELSGGGAPCPFSFDAQDLRRTVARNVKLDEANRGFELLQSGAGVAEEGWVRNEQYESAFAFLSNVKEQGLKAAESAEEREEIMGHWPWDDMDEEKYM
ncbi:hypothetical protein BDW22DRAFT_1486502 [Trametopsis cervina]|nr:hypothetical protein BDW22DRAFT_1486502 [Trametopsis cervina]